MAYKHKGVGFAGLVFSYDEYNRHSDLWLVVTGSTRDEVEQMLLKATGKQTIKDIMVDWNSVVITEAEK